MAEEAGGTAGLGIEPGPLVGDPPVAGTPQLAEVDGMLLVPDEGEGGYTVTVPGLPHVTQGETMEEALEMRRDAIALDIDDPTELMPPPS